MKCVICEKQFKGNGNNAEPIKTGRCCDFCNHTKVVPKRLEDFLKRNNK